MHYCKEVIKRLLILIVTLSLNPYILIEANVVFNNHIISNLNTLANIFDRHVCFILLDNHLTINIPTLDYPTAIRNLDKIYCGKNTTQLFYPSKNPSPNKYNRHPKNCARINLFQFSLQIKPWNCQVQIQVYPTLHMINWKSINYPKIFYYKISIDSRFWEFMEPSSVPHVNMLVLAKPRCVCSLKRFSKMPACTKARHNELIALHYWIQNTVVNGKNSDKNALYLNTNIFIVAYTSSFANNKLKVTSFVRVENCGYCRSTGFGNPALKTYSVKFDTLSLNIFKFVKASQTSNTVWAFKQSEYNDRDDRLINGITNHLRMCHNYLLNSGIPSQDTLRSLANIPFRIAQDRLFHGLASLVQMSLTNYTYNHFRNEICVNGRKSIRGNLFDLHIPSNLEVRGVHSKFSSYQILSLPKKVTNLRFISCGGSRGKQPILFSELVNVYDKYVWIFLLFSCFSLSFILRRIYEQKLSFQKYFLNTLYLLVEQNNKIFNCVKTKASIRFAVCCFALATMVLSNGYRSENMYNITKFRKLIPYERFQELLDNNFTIYSRSSYIYFNAGSLFARTHGAFPNLTTVNSHYLAYSPMYQYILSVTSELYELMMAITGYNEAIDVIFSKLFNNTSLHPKIESIVASTFYPFTNISTLLPASSISGLRETAWNLEHKYLKSFLFDCNKSALVIPEDLANELGRELLLMNMPHVYMGKEIYSGMRLSLFFKGWIQPIVLRRLKFIKESGVWDWWPRFILSSKQFDIKESYSRKEVETPNMKGNIVLLFILLMGCLAGVVLVFIFEVYKMIAFALQNFILSIWLKVSVVFFQANCYKYC